MTVTSVIVVMGSNVSSCHLLSTLTQSLTALMFSTKSKFSIIALAIHDESLYSTMAIVTI